MIEEDELASCYLQNIVNAVARGSASSAETQRISAISHIENALCHGDYTEAQTTRLKRLLKTLNACESDDQWRKYAILECNIVPALISMGLAEET